MGELTTLVAPHNGVWIEAARINIVVHSFSRRPQLAVGDGLKRLERFFVQAPPIPNKSTTSPNLTKFWVLHVAIHSLQLHFAAGMD